jgi:glycerol-3-phosphate O-acyltransferase
MQAWEVGRYVTSNVARLLTRRFQRYGRAAVVVGAPIALGPWFVRETDLFTLDKPERLARVQRLCDELLARVGQLIPVTAVPLVCAAIQSFDSDFIGREALLARVEEMEGALRELNARGLRADRTSVEIFGRAWRMLRMRRVLAETREGYLVLPRGRPLVSYYANGIAHLLGPFMSVVQARDALPAMAGLRAAAAQP